MPRANTHKDGLLDSWGRANNRKYEDRVCPHCGTLFQPRSKAAKYCSIPCRSANNGGHNRKDETWWVNGKGYVEGRVWEGGKQRKVKQHRYFMEQHLGRRLLTSEDVHHRNGNKQDNRLENLELLLSWRSRPHKQLGPLLHERQNHMPEPTRTATTLSVDEKCSCAKSQNRFNRFSQQHGGQVTT